MRPTTRLGIDLGGTKIEVLVINEAGEELFRKRVATPRENYQEIIKAIVDLVNAAEDNLQQESSIGICTPGSISPASNLVRNSNTTCLNSQPFKQDLEQALKQEIRMANDANCFALSEAIDGAAKNEDTVFGVIVGTGVGGGLVVKQQVLVGRNAIAGEWGHNPLPWPERDELDLNNCWCGQKGCIEMFLSGPGLQADYFSNTQNKIPAVQIIQASEQGDINAEQAMNRYENRMARGLAHVINLFDPDVIVLGGGLSNAKRLYENVPKQWDKWIFSDVVKSYSTYLLDSNCYLVSTNTINTAPTQCSANCCDGFIFRCFFF